MKNSLVFLTFFGLIFSCNFDENEVVTIIKDSAWEEDNLKGKVKHITLYKSNIIDIESDKVSNPKISLKKEYSFFGQLLQEEFFDVWEKPTEYTKNEYDKENRLRKSISTSFSAEILDYNEKGNPITYIFDFKGIGKSKTFCKYDSTGNNLLEEITISNKGDTTITSYEKRFGDFAEIKWSKETKEEKGRVIEIEEKYGYDKEKRIKEYSVSSSVLGNIRTVYEYQANGKLLSTTDYNGIKKMTETIYDDLKNPLSIKYYVEGFLEREVKYKYIYDKKDNWIERKVFGNNIKELKGEFNLMFIEKRDLAYF